MGLYQAVEPAVECLSPVISAGMTREQRGEILKLEEKPLKVKAPATPIDTTPIGLTLPQRYQDEMQRSEQI